MVVSIYRQVVLFRGGIVYFIGSGLSMVVNVDRWSLYKGGHYTQVVLIYRWSM